VALRVTFQSVLPQQLFLKGVYVVPLLRCIQMVYQFQYLSVGGIHYIVVVGIWQVGKLVRWDAPHISVPQCRRNTLHCGCWYMASRQAGKMGCPAHSLPCNFCVCQNSQMWLKLQMNSQQSIHFSEWYISAWPLKVSTAVTMLWCIDTECLGAQLANTQVSTK
jgi:hypothetical protein